MAILGAVVSLLFILLLGLGLWFLVTSALMVRRFRRIHAADGKFLVFVYSDSPNWKPYIDEHILPRIEAYAVVLNWSQRSTWRGAKSIEVRIWERWGGDREFNPMAIVIPPTGRVEVVRFWQAFRDSKHGKPFPLKRAQEKLFQSVSRFAGKQSVAV